MGDMRRKRRVSRESNLSPQLKQACEEALKNGEQVILFQNRSGICSDGGMPVMRMDTPLYPVRCKSDLP